MPETETLDRASTATPLKVPAHKRRAVAKAVHRATRAIIHKANGVPPSANMDVDQDSFVGALMDACNGDFDDSDDSSDLDLDDTSLDGDA